MKRAMGMKEGRAERGKREGRRRRGGGWGGGWRGREGNEERGDSGGKGMWEERETRGGSRGGRGQEGREREEKGEGAKGGQASGVGGYDLCCVESSLQALPRPLLTRLQLLRAEEARVQSVASRSLRKNYSLESLHLSLRNGRGRVE